MTPRENLVLRLGRSGLAAAYGVAGGRAHWSVKWARATGLATGLDGRDEATPDAEALNQAVRTLAGDLNQRRVPTHLVVPDPLVSFRSFAIERLPWRRRERLAFARWRMANALGRELETCEVTWQLTPAGRDGRRRLLVSAMDGGWVSRLRDACAAASLVPWCMDMGAAYVFNHFHPTFSATSQGGALVCLDEDSWSLLIWDAQTRLQLARSRWRTEPADSEYRSIADEVERLVRGYVYGDADRHVAQLYIRAREQEVAGLSRLLDEKLSRPCLSPDVRNAPVAVTGLSGGSPSLLSAMVPR